MNKMDILKLALEKCSDPTAAMDLAERMAAFVAQDKPVPPAPAPKPAQASLELTKIAPRPPSTKGRLSLIAPGVMGRKFYATATDKIPARKARAWSDEERKRATAMLDLGSTFIDVARALERTPGAIEKAWRHGMFPTRIKHQPLSRAEQ